MPFNLINEPWLPVVPTGGGERRWVRPAEVATAGDVEFAWGRADLNIATYELLIGLLCVAFPPKDDDDWREKLDTPPSIVDLDAAFAPLVPWFNLDGDGPRFMQDFEGFEGEEVVCDALFIDAPGANTLRNGSDLFVKQARTPVLSRGAAAIALYTLQAFAPTGGAGHRTSMRGGGPLTTLVQLDPDNPLWKRIWVNVVSSGEPLPRLADSGPASGIFPWCAPAMTSENGKAVEIGHAHPLQALFGMPRRIRLNSAADNTTACAISVHVDSKAVVGFTTKNYGINYGESWSTPGWRHPLTAFYLPKSGAAELPVHPRSSRLGYRQWAGLVYGHEDRNSDTGVGRGISANLLRVKNALRGRRHRSSVRAAGYVMDNMKVVDFLEAEVPLILAADKDTQQELETLAHRLVAAADLVAGRLRGALRDALGAGADKTILEGPVESLWSETEQPFRDALGRIAAIEHADVDALDTAVKAECEAWVRVLRIAALDAFNRTVPAETLINKRLSEQKAMIEARTGLVLMLAGKALRESLGLAPVQPKTKSKRGGRKAA